MVSLTIGMAGSKVLFLILVAFTLICSSMQFCHAQEIYTSLVPPTGHKAFLQFYATGEQIYTYNGTTWVNTGAQADLFGPGMICVGKHYYLPHKDAHGGQPTWETTSPKSTVTAKRVFAQKAASASSIDWVLLKSTQVEGDKALLGEVSFVLRVNTVDGLPPAFAGRSINDTYLSPYAAVYVYYSAS